jgi:hypothetical protein
VVTTPGGTPHDDVVDVRGVQAVPTLQLLEDLGQDPLRVYIGESALPRFASAPW